MTKDEILENYLNIAQFGSSRVRRRVRRAVLLQQARHGPQLPRGRDDRRRHAEPVHVGPGRATPRSPQSRRNTVLRLMKEQRYITDGGVRRGHRDAAAGHAARHSPTEAGCAAAGAVVRRVRLLLRLRHQGHRQRPDVRRDAGGAHASCSTAAASTITTTLDPRDCRRSPTPRSRPASRSTTRRASRARSSPCEPGTGKIVAMAQNRDLRRRGRAPRRATTSVNYNTDSRTAASGGFAPGLDVQAVHPRSSGSRQGHSLNEPVNGTERTLNENMFTDVRRQGPERAVDARQRRGRRPA